MEPAIFGIIENHQPGGFENDLPSHYERRGTFWALVSPLLGVKQRFDGDDIDHVAPAIRQLREYEMRRQPPAPTVGDIVADVVDEVREVVGKAVTKVDAAKIWLAERLAAGPVPVTVIEAEGAEHGWNLKLLKVAKSRLPIKSVRKAGIWRWMPLAVRRDTGTV